MKNVTEYFLRYRDIVRLAWNLGFRGLLTTDRTVYAFVDRFEEVSARLFEGMVLLPLGVSDRISDKWDPGKAFSFDVRPKTGRTAELLVDRYLPTAPYHEWGSPAVRVRAEDCRLRFLAWFDWEQLGSRDYVLLKVLITDFPPRPELAGRYALVNVGDCEIFTSKGNEGPQVEENDRD